MRNSGLKLLALAVFVLTLPGMAAAGALSVAGIGPRVGLGINPDQFIVGGQVVMDRVAEAVNLAASIDAGFGDHVTDFAFNADMQIRLPRLPKSNVTLYGLAGPTIVYYDPEFGDGDTELGFSIGGGLKIPMGGGSSYNLEARGGLGDIPDFKLLLGIYIGLGSK